MNRPRGVTVLGWLAIVFGALGLIASLFTLLGALALGVVGAGALSGIEGVDIPAGVSVGGVAMIVLVVAAWLMFLSAVEIVFGIGTLQLRPWAWTLGVVWTWISLVSNILSLFSRGGLFGEIIGILVAIGIMYYLYTDEVRAAFGKSDKMPVSFMVPVFAQMDGWFGTRKSAPPSAGAYPPPGTGAVPPPPGAYPPPGAGAYPPPPAPPAEPAPEPYPPAAPEPAPYPPAEPAPPVEEPPLPPVEPAPPVDEKPVPPAPPAE